MGGVIATGLALVLGLVATLLFAVAEARQRGQAEQNARAAFERSVRPGFRHTAPRWQPRAAALSGHDVADAARQLEAAPADLCAWEWRHLKSRLDDSSAVISWPAGASAPSSTQPEGFLVATSTPAGLRLTNIEGGEHRTLPIGPEHGHHLFIASTRARHSGRSVGRRRGL